MTISQHATVADDLTARMDYFCEAVKVLRATSRPTGPVITRAEYTAMQLSYAMGLSAAGFAVRLANADKQHTPPAVPQRVTRAKKAKVCPKCHVLIPVGAACVISTRDAEGKAIPNVWYSYHPECAS